jgi:hypothetical protein
MHMGKKSTRAVPVPRFDLRVRLNNGLLAPSCGDQAIELPDSTKFLRRRIHDRRTVADMAALSAAEHNVGVDLSRER